MDAGKRDKGAARHLRTVLTANSLHAAPPLVFSCPIRHPDEGGTCRKSIEYRPFAGSGFRLIKSSILQIRQSPNPPIIQSANSLDFLHILAGIWRKTKNHLHFRL
jgi:hypothetical protein